MPSKMYTGNPHGILQFLENLKLYVRDSQCFRILVRVTYAVDVSTDFPGKRAMANNGPLLLQYDEERDRRLVSVLMHTIAC